MSCVSSQDLSEASDGLTAVSDSRAGRTTTAYWPETSSGANDYGVLAGNVDNSLRFVLFVGTMDNHIRANGGEYHGQDDNRYDDND